MSHTRKRGSIAKVTYFPEGCIYIAALGKQNFEWVKGWVDENKTTRGLCNIMLLLIFPKHDSLKYWRLNPIDSYRYVLKSIRFIILTFSDLSGGKWTGVSKESTCADNIMFTLYTAEVHKQLSNSCHRGDIGYTRQLNGISFVTFLARSDSFFNWYLSFWNWVNWLDQQNFYQEKHFSSMLPPP
jgi:hypothetical protein